MRIGNAQPIEHALDRTVFAKTSVQRVEHRVRFRRQGDQQRRQVVGDIDQRNVKACFAQRGGDLAAMEQLAPVLQQELHRVASHHLAAEPRGHILQTTALVNEAYLRLIDWKNVRWQNRAQFFAMASRMMRHILVDYARAQHREKRGGGAVQVSLSQAAGVPLESSADVVALDEALRKLESFAPRQGRVVELRFFGGLSTLGLNAGVLSARKRGG